MNLQEENGALRRLLTLIESDYRLLSSWYSGCEHGFSPAKTCPNENCNPRIMQRLWDDVVGDCAGEPFESSSMNALRLRRRNLMIPEPPLGGNRWHHGNGILVCGGSRIAREDFDSNPPDVVKKQIFDWICATLNKAVATYELARYDRRNEAVPFVEKMKPHQRTGPMPQHIDNMRWEEAPEWATHIVGLVNDPAGCYWAEKRDGRFFSEENRLDLVISFWIIDEDDEDCDQGFGWVVIAERSSAFKTNPHRIDF